VKAALQRRLLAWYRRHGRSCLPWRTMRDPYYTLVSEFMLQQTQVERVVSAFEAFVCEFPNVESLARASRADVVRAWKGLGYNARAVRLHEAAKAVVRRHGGKIPSDTAALRALPGVGPYTASAIRAFAFDLDDLPEDTNVRRIAARCGDSLEPPRGKARDWASALMDLGATVCTARVPKCPVCPLVAGCPAANRPPAPSAAERTKKAGVPFERTARYARGRIVDRLRELPAGQRISLLDLHGDLRAVLRDRTLEEVRTLVGSLQREGVIDCVGDGVALRE
jgi:A/G-specific adenine glycosylase